ncbi:MAG: exodeoxyribonuclease VII small subunit [Syntrophomonadaceae bacterium]|nr:exodeoxyribonuclease VII small subunit [Syntrophomonadaceae bacterium]
MEKIKFEEAMSRLEEILDKLESGEQDLDDSLLLFEEGINLTLLCQQQLQVTEQRMQKLIRKLDGSFELVEVEE